MACCDWCGKSSREITTENNGRTSLRLCPMCHAEYELREMKTLPVASVIKPRTRWQRFWDNFK